MTDYKNLKLRASSNPHIRNGEDTRGLMLDVIIALMPALLFGVWHFGVRVAISAVVSVASAIFFEWLYRKLLHKPQMIGDLSAAVTGFESGWMDLTGQWLYAESIFASSNDEMDNGFF